MKLLFIALSVSFAIHALDTRPTPLQQVEAEHVDFAGGTLHLLGTIRVVHDFGILHCDEATMYAAPGKTGPAAWSSFEKIELRGHVKIDFSDGGHLLSDRGDIDCEKLEGVFTADPPEKVCYVGFAAGATKRTPVRATGRTLMIKMAKSGSEYVLTSLAGAGAVHVECLRPGSTLEVE